MSDVCAPFRDGDDPLDSHPALPSAPAAVAVADPAQPVTAESGIGASDRDAEYGDGVRACESRWQPGMPTRILLRESHREFVRRARLSRWQEQR